jgi:acyl-CoA synthetase (AMP-forming)/AMP-acid ligase II
MTMSDDVQATLASQMHPGVSPTLDDLFRRTVARQPDAIALIDPPNKLRITGQTPQRLTFAQADHAISWVATSFIEAGLPQGSIVAVQLPNTIEFAITVLGAIRAGMIVALLPQLWRQSELTNALNRIGARAVVGTDRIELVDHAELVMNAAAEAFSIRNVFGFGRDLPEGMFPLEIATDGPPDFALFGPLEARKPAIVSFDVVADGFRAVPRNHVQLISGGLAVFLESQVPQGAKLLSAMIPSSFGALAASIVTWLLSAGSLAFHHPADLQLLEKQIEEDGYDTLIAPAPLTLRLSDGSALSRPSTIRHVIGLWRTPDRVASSETWQGADTTLTDVYLFGEIGLHAARRLSDGSPASIAPGPYGASRNSVGEFVMTMKGTLALRGSMVPISAYRPPSSSENPLSEAPAPDYVDTGYAARLDKAKGTITITAPPAGIVAVGGYRFLSQDLDEWARRLTGGAMLTALPDQLNGYRLAGRASDNRRAREALGELGLNPLMVEAFRDRTT